MNNQIYEGNLWDKFNRCVSIVNSGLGGLTEFKVVHRHGNGYIGKIS
jgi:hypothetical protein